MRNGQLVLQPPPVIHQETHVVAPMTARRQIHLSPTRMGSCPQQHHNQAVVPPLNRHSQSRPPHSRRRIRIHPCPDERLRLVQLTLPTQLQQVRVIPEHQSQA